MLCKNSVNSLLKGGQWREGQWRQGLSRPSCSLLASFMSSAFTQSVSKCLIERVLCQVSTMALDLPFPRAAPLAHPPCLSETASVFPESNIPPGALRLKKELQFQDVSLLPPHTSCQPGPQGSWGLIWPVWL